MDKKQQTTVNRLLQAAEGLTLDQIRGVSNEKLDFIVFSLIGEIYICPGKGSRRSSWKKTRRGTPCSTSTRTRWNRRG